MPAPEDEFPIVKEEAEFEYDGIIYKHQYGDLLLWKQIMGEARKKGTKKIGAENARIKFNDPGCAAEAG